MSGVYGLGMDVSTICFSIHPLKDMWVISSLELLQRQLHEHPCTPLSVDFLSFLLDKYLDGEWLDRTVGVVFNFLTCCQTVFHSDYPPACVSSVALCHFEDLILSRYICLMLAVLAGVCWHLIVAFICIFITTSDIEHLFTGLFTIHISSSLKCLFKYFA